MKTIGILFIALAGLAAGCSSRSGCLPGESRGCSCVDGRMGAQTCDRDGAFLACVCSGGGTDGGAPRPDAAGAPACGDGVCNGAESCRSCAGDCGACMTQPVCGDGSCNGSEACGTCAEDCGACPASCGDLTCNGAETCSTCAADCGACTTMCMPCTTTTDCPIGAECDRRRCDGVAGCYPVADPAASCASIGGIRCPATSAYNTCVANTECGPYAECRNYVEGASFCARRCTVDSDCPAPPNTATGVTRKCDSAAEMCYLRCTGPGVCPFGLRCTRYANGTYGYCS